MKVTICMGARCTLMGANAIYDAVEYLQDHLCGPESELCSAENLEIEFAHCLNYCKIHNNEASPVVIVDGKVFTNAKTEVIMEYILDTAFEDKFN